MLECQCKQENNLCDLCCQDGKNGECKPTKDFNDKEELKKKDLKQFPGAPCNDFNGYCDVFLKCRAVDADGPLSRLKNKFFSKEAILGYFEWIKEYWWAVALMGVGLILLMAGNVKLTCIHTRAECTRVYLFIHFRACLSLHACCRACLSLYTHASVTFDQLDKEHTVIVLI